MTSATTMDTLKAVAARDLMVALRRRADVLIVAGDDGVKTLTTSPPTTRPAR